MTTMVRSVVVSWIGAAMMVGVGCGDPENLTSYACTCEVDGAPSEDVECADEGSWSGAFDAEALAAGAEDRCCASDGTCACACVSE